MYLIFTFREFKSIHKGKTAILHLRFGTEKNRRLGSKKARYNRAFRKRHLFCLHIMVRETGLEPVRCKPHAPQTCASASSATLAFFSPLLSRRVLLYILYLILSIVFLKIYQKTSLIFLRRPSTLFYTTKPRSQFHRLSGAR